MRSSTSSGKYRKTNEIVKQIIVHNNTYNIHIERVSGGVQGYVIAENEFICALPLADNEERLLLIAERRLEALV